MLSSAPTRAGAMLRAALGLLLLAASLGPAHASHFRYGVIEWKWMNYNADGTVKAPFDLQVTINHAWRREVAWYNSGSRGESTKTLCAGFDADLKVDWGDGSKMRCVRRAACEAVCDVVSELSTPSVC